MRVNEKLSNEKKFVIAGSRLSNVNLADLITLMKKGLDWNKVVEYSMRNKVLFLLYNNLCSCEGKSFIPNYLTNLIEDSMRCNKVRNDMKFIELESVCEYLEEKGIKIVPVKGAYLIDNIYRDRTIRMTNDLDALVQKNDIQVLEQTMRELGYSNDKYNKETGCFVKYPATQRMLYKTQMYNLLPFIKLQSVPIDMSIIFDFSHSLDFSLDTRPVKEMIESSCLQGKVRKLLPEHYFIHMCCHHYREASHVEWMKIGKDLNLIKFCDVREFILQKMDDEQMDAAIDFAKRYNLEKAVYFVLFFLNIIYHDGYEEKWMYKLNIDSDEFVFAFGESKDGNQMRKKEFWDSFFDADNSDEITIKPRYEEVMY